MSDKLIQLQDGANNVYPTPPPPIYLNLQNDFQSIGIGGKASTHFDKTIDFDPSWRTRIGILQDPFNSGTTIRLVKMKSYEDFGPTENYPEFLKNWLKAVCSENPDIYHELVIGKVMPDIAGIVACYIYYPGDSSDALPVHSGGLFLSGFGAHKLIKFGTLNSEFSSTEIT